MKLILCIVIVAVLCCNKVSANSSADNSSEGAGCLQEYLRQKGKIGVEFPATEWNLRCRFITITALRILNNLIENKVTSGIPGVAVACLIKEFSNQDTSDVIVKLEVIKKSTLSENEKETLTKETEAELRDDLARVAIKCETDKKKFIEIFNEYFGIKSPRNETLSAMEHNYCFAKYVADNHLLPLDNLELNPYGIKIGNVNCDAIIREEEEQQEEDLRKKLKTQPSNVVDCIVEEYKNQNLFQSHVSALVLSYLDFPKDVEDSETEKVKTAFGRAPLIGFLCTVADSESK